MSSQHVNTLLSAPTPAGPGMVVELMGGLRLRQGGRLTDRFLTQKAAGVLAYLAYFRDRLHPREVLAEKFWPDAASPEKARSSLAVVLSSLRKQMEGPGVHPGIFLVTTPQLAGVNSERVTSDVARFEYWLQRAETSASMAEATDFLGQALTLYRPELLPGFYDEWITREQERLQDRFTAAACRLARYLDTMGKRDEALFWCREAVRNHPAQVQAMLPLFQWLLETGQTTEIVNRYQELKAYWDTELSLPVPQEVTALAAPFLAMAVPQATTPTRAVEVSRTIAMPATGTAPRRRGRPARTSVLEPMLEATPAVLAENNAAATPRADAFPATTYLPLPLTRFFGREEELARLQSLFDEKAARLVTLTGPGGGGKTRLALRLAETLCDPFRSAPWRVYFVSLVEVRESERLLEALGRETGAILRSAPSAEIFNALVAHLSAMPTFLILDNFEHLAETDAPGTVLNLLQRVPRLSCLVTSRQRLPLHGEREFPLAPLPVPETGAEQQEIETLMQESPAFALFVDRAQLAQPQFQVSFRNVAAVVEIIRRLEGIPLALELAAARLRVVSPAQMLVQLSQRLDLLVSHRSMFSERHRSLREAIAWSYQLLSPPVQRFFARLCVLRGVWTIEDAEAMTGEADVVSCLEQLCDASLLQVERDTEPMQFRMLETLREFACEQLTEGERTALKIRHADYFVETAQQAKRLLDGAGQVVAMDRLWVVHENCCAALDWCLDTPGREALERACRMGAALVRFWRLGSFARRGRQYLEAICQRAEWSELPLTVQVAVSNGAGVLALSVQDNIEAARYFEACLLLTRQLHAPEKEAAILNNLGSLAAELSDYGAAERYLNEALATWERTCNWRQVVVTHHNLGRVFALQGDNGRAKDHLEQAFLIARKEADAEVCGMTRFQAGMIAIGERNWSQAARMMKEGILYFAPLNAWGSIALCLLALGVISETQGFREDAEDQIPLALAYCTIQQVSIPAELLSQVSPVWRHTPLPPGSNVEQLEQRLKRAVAWLQDEMPTPVLHFVD